MFLTIPAAVGLALLRGPATVLLLQRGEFTAADAAITASALGWYCLGIVPQAGIEIHSRGFYALGDTRTPVMLAVGAVLVNFVLSAVLWSHFEHEGLAFSVSAASWAEWLLLWRAYGTRTGAEAAPDLAHIARIALAAAAMGLFIALFFSQYENATMAQNAVTAIAGAAAGGLVYAALGSWFRMPELTEAVRRLRR